MTDNTPESVKCRSCGKDQSVQYVLANDACCLGCGRDLCVICGCTEEAACVHPDFPAGELNCSWQMPGLCDHCFAKTAEAEYLEAVEVYEKVILPRLGPGGVTAVLNS